MVSAPRIKTAAQVEEMRPACELTARALRRVEGLVKPGVTTLELDRAAEAFIRDGGGEPLFLHYPSHTPGVRPFPGTLCVSVNDEVVHGIPNGRVLAEGDVISVDVGARLDGWCGDCAATFPVGGVAPDVAKLLAATREALVKGIAAMRADGWLKDVSKAIQKEIEGRGFSVVKQFVGHGIGRDMHEPPQVPNYVGGLKKIISGENGLDKLRLVPGLVLAVEPMANMGKSGVYVEPRNGWTVKTSDRSVSAHFEHTIAVTEEGPRILTVA